MQSMQAMHRNDIDKFVTGVMTRVKTSRARAKKPLEYAAQAPGSKLAAQIRRRANKLTPEQRQEHFRQAIAMIHAGDQAVKASRASTCSTSTKQL
jgi:hypothetical protein